MQPTLTSSNLTLRPFCMSDVERVQNLVNDERIADVTAHIPHPYSVDDAIDWISKHETLWNKRELAVFAIERNSDNILVGAISLMELNKPTAELGYWIGVGYWGKGYATEAAQLIVRFGLEELQLKRIFAHHLSRNPASGKVLTKAGFTYLGKNFATCGYKKHQEDVAEYEIVRP